MSKWLSMVVMMIRQTFHVWTPYSVTNHRMHKAGALSKSSLESFGNWINQEYIVNAITEFPAEEYSEKLKFSKLLSRDQLALCSGLWPFVFTCDETIALDLSQLFTLPSLLYKSLHQSIGTKFLCTERKSHKRIHGTTQAFKWLRTPFFLFILRKLTKKQVTHMHIKPGMYGGHN